MKITPHATRQDEARAANARRASGVERASASGLKPSSAGFTLIEMLLALAVSAIVLAGIGGVFYSAIRLRERTAALVDASAPLYQALSFVRRDLQGVMPPGGVMAGDFKLGTISSDLVQGYGLQFSTTTGIIRDDAPWGDIQDVVYELRDPTERNYTGGKDLIRSITRNLLPTTTQDATEQWLMGNVQSLEVAGFDGNEWRESWDSSLGDTNLPVAVRLRIQLAADNPADNATRQPIEMIIPLGIQSRTNTVQTTEGLP
jgi:general secretion pathway protein J